MREQPIDAFSESYAHAFVHRDARVPASTKIGVGTFIGPSVVLGEDNIIGNGACITGMVHLGHRNYLASHVTIGGDSRQRLRPSPWDERALTEGPVVIGDDNLFFEHSNVHAPMRGITRIGNWVSIGANCHIAHDVQIESYVTIAPHSVLGGYCVVGYLGNLGMHASLYPRVVVGSLAVVGMGARVLSHVRPGCIVVGCPAQFLKPNYIGMERAKLTAEERSDLVATIETGAPPGSERVRAFVLAFESALKFSRSSRAVLPTRRPGRPAHGQ